MIGFLLGILAFLLFAAAVVAASLLFVFRKPLFSREYELSRPAVPTLRAQMVGELLIETTEQNLPEPSRADLTAVMSSFAIAAGQTESESPAVASTMINVLDLHSREVPIYREVQEEYVNLMRRVIAKPQYVRALA